MISFIISAIKIVFLLGFLIFIHEAGHCIVAKLCKVKVNEFSIGFGPKIFAKKTKETQYTLRMIPLGGFCSMEGEIETSEKDGSFSKASIPKRIAIVSAGAIVNIVFGLIVYFILMSIIVQFVNPIQDTVINRISFGVESTKDFTIELGISIKQLFTGKIGLNQMTGPIGISEVVSKTTGISEYIYLLAVISLSLGVTNLIPIPALDGGKILILIIEAIRKKPMKEEFEIKIQLIGFSILIALSLYVTYNDMIRIF